MNKKVISVLLSILMVATMLPVSLLGVFAEGLFAEDPLAVGETFVEKIQTGSSASTTDSCTFKVTGDKEVILIERGDGKTSKAVTENYARKVTHNEVEYTIKYDFSQKYEGIDYMYTVTNVNPLELGVKDITDPGDTIFGPLPETYEFNGVTYWVNTIASGAFQNNKTIKTVNIPSSIKYIQSDAFSGSAVSTVTFSEGLLEIGSNAFRYTPVKSIKLPESLTSIGTRVFDSCKDLEYVYIGNNLSKFGSAPFENSGKTDEEANLKFEINAQIIPNTLSYETVNAFTNPLGTANYSNVTEIVLGKNVETICFNAFNAFTGVKTWTLDNDNKSIVIENGVIYGVKGDVKTKLLYTMPGTSSVKIPATVEEINCLKGINPEKDDLIKAEKYNVHKVDGVLNDGLRCGEMLKVGLDDSYSTTNKIKYLITFDNAEQIVSADNSGEIRSFISPNSADTPKASNPRGFSMYGGADGFPIYSRSMTNYFDCIALLTSWQYFSVAHLAGPCDVVVYAFEEKDGELVLLDVDTVALGARDNKKAIDGNAVLMFKGETKLVSEVLLRAGVTHVSCGNCSYKDVETADTYDNLKVTSKVSGTKTNYYLNAGEPDPSTSYTVNFKFTGKNCAFHDNVTDAEYTLGVKVIDPIKLAPEYSDALKITGGFEPDYFTYTINGVEPDENGVFIGLDPDTDYVVEVTDKDTGAKTTVKGKTNPAETHVPDNFDVTLPDGAECGDTPAQEATVTFIELEKAPTAEITVSYYKVEDEAETLLESAPTTCGTYRVKVSTARDRWYNPCDGLVVGEYTIAHKLSDVEATKLCTEDGHAFYKECACGEYFEDENGVEIEDLTAWLADDGKVEPYGEHDYVADESWVWADDCSTATLGFTCSRDEDHIDSVTAKIADGTIVLNPDGDKDIVAATCDAGGKDVYVATIEGPDGETYTDKKIVDTDPLPHDYKAPVWEWTEYSKAVATFVCNNFATHVETRTAEGFKIEVIEEVAPSCTQDGYRKYQATVEFGGETYTDTKTEPLNQLGHNIVLKPELSGVTPDGTVKWDVYMCSRNCGEGYIDIQIIAKDDDGKTVDGASVSINGAKAQKSGTTANGGKFVADKLPLGEYDITVSFFDDVGVPCSAKGKISADGKNPGSANLGIVHNPNNYESEFVCSFCPKYNELKDIPFVGWVVSIVHMFIHFAEHIGKLT